MIDDDDKPAMLTSLDSTLKDMYALPGTRIKQWVVDHRRELDWEEKTAPRVNVDPHDRAGCLLHGDSACEHCKALTHRCPCDGSTNVLRLRDSECDTCGALWDRARSMPSMMAWLAEKAARPPICADRAKLSDEIAPEWPVMGENYWFRLVPK